MQKKSYEDLHEEEDEEEDEKEAEKDPENGKCNSQFAIRNSENGKCKMEFICSSRQELPRHLGLRMKLDDHATLSDPIQEVFHQSILDGG